MSRLTTLLRAISTAILGVCLSVGVIGGCGEGAPTSEDVGHSDDNPDEPGDGEPTGDEPEGADE